MVMMSVVLLTQEAKISSQRDIVHYILHTLPQLAHEESIFGTTFSIHADTTFQQFADTTFLQPYQTI
jgi:hypothetical protein